MKRFLKATPACLAALPRFPDGVESFIEHPANRRRLGISDSLIRLSVGAEDIGDLRHELEVGTALNAGNLGRVRNWRAPVQWRSSWAGTVL